MNATDIKTLDTGYYGLHTVKERWDWIREANRARCQRAAEAKAGDPVDPDDDFDFAVLNREAGEVGIDDFELDPPV